MIQKDQSEMHIERIAFQKPAPVNVEKQLYKPHCPKCGYDDPSNLDIADGHEKDTVELLSKENKEIVLSCGECGYRAG